MKLYKINKAGMRKINGRCPCKVLEKSPCPCPEFLETGYCSCGIFNIVDKKEVE